MKDKRLYHTVAQSILDMIESGAYPVGTRLPGERALAEKFSVSRVVIREAEISLEAVGRLEIKVGSGVYVRNPASSTGLALENVTAFGLTQTRFLFESECAAFAAAVITDEQITKLEATVERMAAAPLDSQEAHIADHDFHLQIAEATGNEVNVIILQNIWRMRNEVDAVKRVYVAVGHTDANDRVKEHTDIMDALRNRDPAAARKAMQKHFSRLLNALFDASEEQLIEEARKKSAENRRHYMQGSTEL